MSVPTPEALRDIADSLGTGGDIEPMNLRRADIIRSAADFIERYSRVPATERLPDAEERVLVIDTEDTWHIAWLFAGEWESDSADFDGVCVLAWIRLPMT